MKQQRGDTARVSKGLPPKLFSNDTKIRIQEKARTLFRAALLRKYTAESLRVFCRNVADSPLRQWFCGINRFVAADIFSKSNLAQFENDLPSNLLRQAHAKLLQAACNDVDQAIDLNPLGLEAPISLRAFYADTTVAGWTPRGGDGVQGMRAWKLDSSQTAREVTVVCITASVSPH